MFLKVRLALFNCHSPAKSTTPLQVVSTAEDVADAALFLISDAARRITGETLLVDANLWFGDIGVLLNLTSGRSSFDVCGTAGGPTRSRSRRAWPRSRSCCRQARTSAARVSPPFARYCPRVPKSPARSPNGLNG